jgi:hypothetical protein
MLFCGQPAVAQFSEPSSGNCVISGGINNGLQIQNCPIIEQAPTPTFHVVKEFPIVDNSDKTFTRAILIQIDAPYVPMNMVIFAFGGTVTGLGVANTTMIMGGPTKTLGGNYAYLISEPSGRYTVSVKTSDKETPPAIQIMFNDANIYGKD